MVPSTAPLAVFVVAALALNISPGPDMLYVISRSLGNGRRAGIVSALGIGAGTLVHTFVTAIGLSAILLSSPVAFELIRYAGAVYLAYLGIRMLLTKSGNGATKERLARDDNLKLSHVFRQGATTNILNPKVALFFLAFLPQFVDQSKGTAAVQMILLGLLFDTSGTSVNVIVATLAGHASESLKRHAGFGRIQRMIPGAILIGLALLVAFR